MNGRQENLNEEALKRAYELLNALLDDHLSGDTREKISGWFKSDVSVNEKYSALQSIFRSLDPNLYPDEYEYGQLAEIRAKLDFPKDGGSVSPQLRRAPWRRVALRVAAVLVPVLVAAGVAYFVWDNRHADPTQPVYTEITVPAASGADREVVLADNSQVRISPDSRLSYPADFATDRQVNLVSGEAFFNVTKTDGEEPFTVSTEHLTVTVVGTEFTVSAMPGADHTTVTLFSGVVEVEVKADGVKTVMNPGEIFDFNHQTREVTSSSVSAEYMIQGGYTPGLIFNDAAFADIIRSVEANHGVTFSIPQGIDLQEGRYSVDLRGEDLSGVLELLSMLNGRFSYSIDGDKVIMSKQ